MNRLPADKPGAPVLAPTSCQIVPEAPAHQIAVEDLHAFVFGPGRFARTAYRVRGRQGHDRCLSFVAFDDSRLVASVWQTFVRIGQLPGVFLGPLAVNPEYAGRGFGQALLAVALQAARSTLAEVVILIGDAPYYAKAGFVAVGHQRIGWPGPIDPGRVLAVELKEGAIGRLSGPIRAARFEIGDD